MQVSTTPTSCLQKWSFGVLELVNWAEKTLILKSTTADRLQSEHLGVAVFFQVRSENQSWSSLPALHTDVHSELWPSWTHSGTTEGEFARITCTFPHQVGLHSLAGSGIVTFHKIIVKPHLKSELNNIFKEIIFEIGADQSGFWCLVIPGQEVGVRLPTGLVL